jgi:hypothetical protein
MSTKKTSTAFIVITERKPLYKEDVMSAIATSDESNEFVTLLKYPRAYSRNQILRFFQVDGVKSLDMVLPSDFQSLWNSLIAKRSTDYHGSLPTSRSGLVDPGFGTARSYAQGLPAAKVSLHKKSKEEIDRKISDRRVQLESQREAMRKSVRSQEAMLGFEDPELVKS